jgi:hypothetical protein
MFYVQYKALLVLVLETLKGLSIYSYIFGGLGEPELGFFCLG